MVRIVAWALACAIAALPVYAADAPPPAPKEGGAPRTPPAYVSAFSDYYAWREPERVPWRRANDEVGRLGGHAGHLRGEAARVPAGEPRGERPVEKR